MLLLTVNSFDPDRWSDMLDRAVAVYSTGEEVVLRCYVDGDYVYCLDDPTWVAALIDIGVPVTIDDYPFDAIISTDWQDFGARAAVSSMVDHMRSRLGRGEIYNITESPSEGCLHCTNYSEIRDIALQRTTYD